MSLLFMNLLVVYGQMIISETFYKHSVVQMGCQSHL